MEETKKKVEEAKKAAGDKKDGPKPPAEKSDK